MAAFVLALVRFRTVNLTQVAAGLNPNVAPSSNYRRLQRFFEGFEVCQLKLAKWVLSLLEADGSGWIEVLDRTEWEFGRQKLNAFVCYLTPTPGMSKKRGCYGLQPGAPPLLS